MDYLYSLYDVLVSINVPTDKARAVVDAMERDMGTGLATKVDLHQFRGEIAQEFVLVRKDLQALESGLRKDLELLSVTMTVRLGSMLVIGLGVLFAALKLV